MNTFAIKKVEIMKELSHVPENKLDMVKSYIDSLLDDKHKTGKSNKSLKGIWKEKGFNNIVDLDSEIKKVRKEMADSILNRKI